MKTFGAEYLFAAVTLIIAAFVIGWYLNRSVEVNAVSVSGNHMAETGEIVAAGGVDKGVAGDSIVFLEVIERVETLPWIAAAHVNLSPSGRLHIRVEEEEPMALLIDDGRSALVTGSGIQLPVVLGKKVDVPILYGFEVAGRADTLRSEKFEQARAFLTGARNYPGLYPQISEVMVTETDGVVVLTNENAIRLTFGHERFDERLGKWQAFQSQVISEKGASQVNALDFRFRGQVVAREQ